MESRPTKFILANQNLNRDRARGLFDLNHTEATLITQLAPKRQALLKRPDLSKVINLTVDPESQRIYGAATVPMSTP